MHASTPAQRIPKLGHSPISDADSDPRYARDWVICTGICLELARREKTLYTRTIAVTQIRRFST